MTTFITVTSFEKIWNKRWVHHVLFWGMFFSFSLFMDVVAMLENDDSVSYKIVLDSLLRTIVSLACLVPFIYVNLLVLVPRFLKEKKIPLYVLSLVVCILVYAPIYFWVSKQLIQDTEQLKEINEGNLAYWIILTAFSLTIWAAITTGLKLGKDWLRQQQHSKELEKQQLTSELKFLRTQVNPHFLFNTLNNIYSLTLKKDERAPDVVLRLSHLMRYILYECNERFVSLAQEIEFIKNYVELESIRQNNKHNINLKIEGEVKDQKIAPLLFLPLLENGIKHGLNSQMQSGNLAIHLNIDKSKLYFEIKNDYSKEVKKSNVGGIGLENVQRRLDLIYTDKHTIRIKESSNQFLVEVNLDL